MAAMLALSACVSSPTPVAPTTASSPSASSTPGQDANPAGFESFYSQKLAWKSCSGKDPGTYQCTDITAPLDWSHADAGTIKLAVIRRLADDGKPLGSLLTNPGGPGASGYDMIADSAFFAVTKSLARVYNAVGFDPRGVGRSTAVKCFDSADMNKYLFDIPSAPRNSDAWKAELTAANKTFVSACEANSNGILKYITTDNAARDMDLMRGVLGDKKLNYLGYSYGTFLGATYAKLFPERVGRFVLDGAIDPSVSGLDVSTTQALGFESALRAYMANCLTTSNCPYKGTLDRALGDLGTLLASVDKDPITNSDGRRLGADTLVTAIVTAMYSKDNWEYLTQALSAAEEGDPSVAFDLADFYYNRNASGKFLDNSTEAFNAYNCMDYPVDHNAADKAASKKLIAEKAPTIAPYWGGVDICDVWPFPATGVREKITADGAAPIVVLGTTNDPATPYAWSKSLAAQLSSGVLLTREGEGHTGFNKGNSCIDKAVIAYFTQGTVPEDGLVCR